MFCEADAFVFLIQKHNHFVTILLFLVQSLEQGKLLLILKLNLLAIYYYFINIIISKSVR